MSVQVTLDQAANLIATCGTTNTFLLQGQPGVGKSAILGMLAKQLPDYLPCYIDVANLDLGDLGMPVIDRDRMVTTYAPNSRFGIGRGQDRPVALMLDELGKGSRPIINMLLPVILERRLGDVNLPTGSIVFGTTNLATDGVGDNVPAHAWNRMSVLDVANPASDAWIAWGMEAGVSPEVLAFAREYPQVFERYDLLSKDVKNPYIFNPSTGNTRAFCSPRSLEKASNIVKMRAQLGDALLPALIGTVGDSAARDMEAYVQLADRVTPTTVIAKDPAFAPLPDGVGAYFLMSFKLAATATPETLDAFITYVDRWKSFEAATLFINSLASSESKVRFCVKNRAFTQKCAKLGKYFS